MAKEAEPHVSDVKEPIESAEAAPPPAVEADVEKLMAAPALSIEDVVLLRKAVFSDEARYRTLGAVAEKLGREKGLEKDLDLKVRYGTALWVLRKTAEAMKVLDGCRASIAGAYVAGRCLMDLDKPREAADLLEKTLNRKPNSLDAGLALVTALEKCGEIEKCQKVLSDLKALNADNDDVIYHLGFCKDYEGFHDEASALYEKALAKNPYNEGALFKLAFRADLYDDEETAVAYYRKCIQVKPPNLSAIMNLGVLYEDAGKFEEAAKCYAEVLKTYPNHPRAKTFLVDAESSMNMFVDEERERKEDKLAQVLRIPITDFELSVRSRNCLKKMQIQTLGDLIIKTESELLSYKNFGETSLAEIKAILDSKSLTLGMDLNMVEPREKHVEVHKLLDSGSEDARNKPISDLGLSIRSRKCMDILNVRTIGDLMTKTEDELLSCKNFGMTSLQDVRQKLAQCGLELPKE